MALDLSDLSKALDLAAPDRKLAAAIRSQKARIESEIAKNNVAFVEVDGQKFRIVHTRQKQTTNGKS